MLRNLFQARRFYVKPSIVRLSSKSTAVENVGASAKVEAVEAAPLEVVPESDLDLLKKINNQSIEYLKELSRLPEGTQIQYSPKVAELDSELRSFFNDFLGTKEKFSSISTSESELQLEYPFLKKSSSSEPYTAQELFLRRKKHSEVCGSLGSEVKDVYRPHLDLAQPLDYKEVTIEKLMAAGAHLGHAVSLWRPSCQPYIYGEYKGIHIIDLEQTLSHLKRAAKVVEGVAEKGGVILFVGTREGHERALDSAARRCNGYFNPHRWVPGTITNSPEIARDSERIELDMQDEPTNRMLSELESSSINKPDLIVFLNPVENRTGLKEAMQGRVPTIGIIDTDSEPSFVTYPIPANDDSLRTVNLICGILAKAGEVGRKRRLANVAKYKQQLQNRDE